MKQILMITLAMVMALPLFGQEMSRKEKRKHDKELRKEKQAEELAQKAAIVKLMVENQRFVLEADRLRDKRGTTVNVPSSLNFVAIDSTGSVIQIGSNMYVGMNGVGGITIEGQVNKYEYSFNERSNSYNVSWYVRTSTGTYDVSMFVYADGRAEAHVASNWPGKVNYIGYAVPVSLSSVFKGVSRY